MRILNQSRLVFVFMLNCLSRLIKKSLFTFCSKRFQSLTGQESVNIGTNQVDSSATTTDLDSLKQEILAEVRQEINKAKQEIIEGWSH